METFYGVGYYTIQHTKFPYKRALKVFDSIERPALSFVWGTFGNSTTGVHEWFRKVNTSKTQTKSNVFGKTLDLTPGAPPTFFHQQQAFWNVDSTSSPQDDSQEFSQLH